MALRNVIHRRNHKERSQLSHRKHLGLLEKHKDYVQRAADHHSKRDRIKRLREKAALKNKDEFYFGMVNAKTKGGVHMSSRPTAQALSTPLVQLLKTQDAGALRLQLRAETKRITKLISRIAPAVPGMRLDWLEEPVKRDSKERNRRQVLEQAGLLKAESAAGGGKGKKKASSMSSSGSWYDEEDTRTAGTIGKKTVWCDGVEQLRNYEKSPSSEPGPSSRRASDDLSDFDSDINPEELDSDDDDTSTSRRPPSSSSTTSKAQDEKYIGYLISLLAARQQRQDVLSEATSKLSLVRNLMSTKGSAARNVTEKQNSAKRQSLTNLVAEGKMTSNGLALPGNENEDDAEDEDGNKRKKGMRIFKWSKERKR